MDENEIQESPEEPNKIQALNENFFYNSMLARALLQIVPFKERKGIRIWFDRLAELDGSDQEIQLRHEYMWFLLLMLETRKIREPFCSLPPKEILPLKDAVPIHIYEEVLMSNDQGNFIDPQGVETKEQAPSVKTSAPSKFLENQPTPKNGIVCYLAAFSDQDF